MSITSTSWREALDGLLHEPPDTFQHRLGDELTVVDEAGAFKLLTSIIVEDPSGTAEYVVAGQMLHLLTSPEVSA